MFMHLSLLGWRLFKTDFVNPNGKKREIVFSPYFLLKGKVQEGNNWSDRWVHHNLVSYLTHANMVSAQKRKGKC